MTMSARHKAAAIATLFCLTTSLAPAGAQVDTGGRPPENGTGVIEVLPVQGGVLMIAGGPSNVAVQIGDQGAVVVDTGVAATTERILAEIGKLTKRPIRAIINTSGAPDHIGGNDVFAKAGAALPALGVSVAGASIFAHEQVLLRLSDPRNGATTVPSALWPTDTYAGALRKLYFNDEPIELRHQPNAFSDGDTIVFFRRSDVVVAGDVFAHDRYPKFDPAVGGSIEGVLKSLNQLVAIAVPAFNQQGGTRIIPGHGRLANQADVVEYRDMTTIVRDRVRDMMMAGKSLNEIQMAHATLEYDGLYSRPSYDGRAFVEAIYRDLAKAKQTQQPRSAVLR